MNNSKIRSVEFRNPLFNPYVVERSLITLREITDQLLTLIPVKDMGLKGKEAFSQLVDIKINEITDELTLDRLER